MKAPLAAVGGALLSAAVCASADCRCLPSDSCWPASAAWSDLNATLDGRLIATVPIGSPCHDPHYDEAACASLKSSWMLPPTQYVCCAMQHIMHYAPES